MEGNPVSRLSRLAEITEGLEIDLLVTAHRQPPVPQSIALDVMFLGVGSRLLQHSEVL